MTPQQQALAERYVAAGMEAFDRSSIAALIAKRAEKSRAAMIADGLSEADADEAVNFMAERGLSEAREAARAKLWELAEQNIERIAATARVGA